MSDEPTDGVLGSLPRTRPHRRSAKRGPAAEPARPAQAGPPPARAASPTTEPTSTGAKGKPAQARTKPTPAKAKAKAKPKAKPASAGARTKRTPAAKARAQTPGGRGAAGSEGRPVRSLQSATTPRAAGDRSRKPGATSQAHHQGAARPSQPPAPRRSAPPAAEPAGALGTAVQAAAELTEIGLKASARAVRGALSRLPRP